MTDVLDDLSVLAQRYLDAWNQTDPAARRQAVEALYTEDARYVDPLVDARGHEAIDATIAAAQAQFPGSVFRLAGRVDAHHDVARFTWELVPADAPDDAEAPVVGFDVAATDGHGRCGPSSGSSTGCPPADRPAAGAELLRARDRS